MANLTVLTSCDANYFKNHGIYFIKSVVKNSPDVNLWIDIINPTQECKDAILSLANQIGNIKLYLSYDEIDLSSSPESFKRAYYSSSRYSKSYLIINNIKSDLLILDIDSLVRGDLNLLKKEVSKGNYDIGVHTRFEQKNPISKVLIGTLYIRYNKYGVIFLKDFAIKIHNLLKFKKSEWFLDQKSFYKIYLKYKNKIKLYNLPLKYIDWKFLDQSIIWTAKGKRKDDSVYLDYKSSFTKQIAETELQNKDNIIFRIVHLIG